MVGRHRAEKIFAPPPRVQVQSQPPGASARGAPSGSGAEPPAAPAGVMIPPRPLCIPNPRQDRWYALERQPSKIMEARALNARANRKGAGAFSEEGSHLGRIKPQRIPLR